MPLSPVVLSLWVLSIVARAACLAILVKRGLALKYWGLSFLLAISLARSGWLAMLSGDVCAYRQAWIISHPFQVAAYAIASFEGFMEMARGRKMGTFGTALLSAFAAISFLVVWSASGIGTSGWLGSDPVMLIGRNFTAICLLFLLCANKFFSYSAMRGNARRFSRVLVLWMAGESLTLGLWFLDRNIVVQFVALAMPTVCAALWALVLTREGETEPPRMTAEQYDALMQGFEERIAALHSVRRAVSTDRRALLARNE